MNDKFDELTKSMAESVTRRGALKKFGLGLAGMVLASIGLTSKAQPATRRGYCALADSSQSRWYTGACIDLRGCVVAASTDCPAPWTLVDGSIITAKRACGRVVDTGKRCTFTL